MYRQGSPAATASAQAPPLRRGAVRTADQKPQKASRGARLACSSCGGRNMTPKKKKDTQKKARPRGAVSLPGGRRVLHAWRCRCLRVRLVYFRTACTHRCMPGARGVRETVAHAEGRCCCFLCETSACIFYNDKGRKGAMMLTDAARPLELRTWQPTLYAGAEVQGDSCWLPSRKNTGGHRRCIRGWSHVGEQRRLALFFVSICPPSICYPGSPCTLALSLGRPAEVAPREEPEARCGPPPQCTLCESKGGAGRTLRRVVGHRLEANGPCTPTPQHSRKPLRRTGGLREQLTGDTIPAAVRMRWSAVFQCIVR